MYKLFIRTWKKLVEPRVTMGDRTSLLETTCIRNTSAMDRLSSVCQSRILISVSTDTNFKSVRYRREMRTYKVQGHHMRDLDTGMRPHLALLIEYEECLVCWLASVVYSRKAKPYTDIMAPNRDGLEIQSGSSWWRVQVAVETGCQQSHTTSEGSVRGPLRTLIPPRLAQSP